MADVIIIPPNMEMSRLVELDRKKIYTIRLNLCNKTIPKDKLQEYTKNLKKVFKKLKIKVIILVTYSGMDTWIEEK